MAFLRRRNDIQGEEFPVQHGLVGLHVPDRCVHNEYESPREGAPFEIFQRHGDGMSSYSTEGEGAG